ncbi:MAG: hypothetical protein U0457_10850 [Candidatus Sericytochromatia bacterium]
MCIVRPNGISLNNNTFKVAKTTNEAKPEKTIDLTLLSKEEDLKSINNFISSVEKNSVEIKNWNIKVADQYIDLSANPQEALKIMKNLKSSIESGGKFKGDLKLNGKDSGDVFFKEVRINTFNDKTFGEHDTDGYTLNPLDNTFLNVFTDDSDRVNDIVVGQPLNVFSSVTDAENFSKNRTGTELILKNNENLYVVYDVKRKENTKEYKSSDGDGKIRAADFTDNHSRFNKGFLNSVSSNKGFMVTDDNKTLEVAGQAGIQVSKADYNVVDADLQLRMIDVNGIQKDGLQDWQGTLNGSISIDVKSKLEETLNKLDLPKGTRVNVVYDEKAKEFDVKLNYEMISERFGELTALRIKPEADGSLSIRSMGNLVNANLNLTDGLAVKGKVNVPFVASVAADGSVSMKDMDKIDAKAGAEVEIKTPLTLPNIKVGANVNPNMQRNTTTNKFDFNPNLTKGNANIFPDLKVDGKLIPQFVEDKTGSWETDAHKAIAGSIISVAESMEKGGFIVPQSIKNVKNNLKNWGTESYKSQEVKDKQVINDFVNGKIKLEYDISKQMNLKGFPNANINQFDPNIKFTGDGQKLNVVFDNSKLVASSDGKSTTVATQEGRPDGLSIDVSANLNNTTASVDAKARLQVNIDDKERKDFSKKLTDMGMNPNKAEISGDLTIDTKLHSELNSTDLSKVNLDATVNVKANDVSVFDPTTNTKISLRKAKADGDLKVVQEGKNTVLKADTKVSLSGFNVYKGNERLVAVGSAAFSGKLSYEHVQSEDKKSQKTKVLVQGHLDVSSGKYDDFSVKNLKADGLVAYTEKTGVTFGATTEAAIKLSGNITNEKEGINLNIKNVSGYGKIDVDQSGNIKSADIKAGASGKNEFRVAGKIKGEDFILESDLKAHGKVKIDKNGEKTTFSLKGDIDRLKTGNIDLEDFKNINAKVTFDPVTNSVTLKAETGKNLDLKGKIQGQEFIFKGDAEVTLQVDKATGKFTLTPNAKVEHLKVGDFDLKDAELNGAKISVDPSNGKNKVSIDSLENQNLNFKGDFISGKNNTTHVDIKGKGSINFEATPNKTTGKMDYSVSTKNEFENFEIGDFKLKNAVFDGKVGFDGQNISLNGNTNEYLKFKGTQINKHTNKETNLDFEAKGNLTIKTDKNDGLNISMQNVELKKGLIDDYLIEDTKINGKLNYQKAKDVKTLNFSGLDEKNPNLELSGKLTKTYKDLEGKEQKYVSEISNLALQGSVSLEDNKLKFHDLKTEVKGKVNGVSVNNIIAANTEKDGSLDIKLGNSVDGVYLGDTIKVKELEDGRLSLKPTTKNGSLKIGSSKDDIISMLDDLNKLNSVNASSNLPNDIKNIKQQLATFSTLNMRADLDNFSIIYDPKNKNMVLDSDLNGQIGTKVIVDPNNKTDINFRNVDITGKLKADTESNNLTITNGVMSGTTDNIEDMILGALAKSGAIPKDYVTDKEKHKISFNMGGKTVNIDTNKTGIGEDSQIGLKTGTKLAGINFNYKMKSKVTVENIAPKDAKEPKNVIKIHLDKSSLAGLMTVDLDGKGKTLGGLIKVNLNKQIEGNRTPYLDFIETLDNFDKNTEKDYKEAKTTFENKFLAELPKDTREKEKNRKLEKALKENNLDSFDNYQKHTGAVQLLDGRTIIFDLEQYLKTQTGGNADFKIEPSKNVLSGDKDADHFKLGFSVTVKNMGPGKVDIPKDVKEAKSVTDIIEQVPEILNQTLNVTEQVDKVAKDINTNVNNTVNTVNAQKNNALGQMRNINTQLKNNIKR